jgi:hypothetical protein
MTDNPDTLRVFVAHFTNPGHQKYNEGMACADAWEADRRRLEALEKVKDVVVAIRQWDMLGVTADGEYWKGLIDTALKRLAALAPQGPGEEKTW